MAGSGLAFVIEEIVPGGADDKGAQGGSASAGGGAAPVKFSWDATNRAAPREGWPGGIRIRKLRDEPNGSDEVIEQVLGPSWKPFQLSGEWDDRYGGKGFAQEQLDAFRKMLQRGRLARFTMGTETIVGSFEDFDFVRLVARTDGTWWRVSWSFTATPHYMVAGGEVRRQQLPANQPAASASTNLSRVLSLVQLAAAYHGTAPRLALAGGIFATLQGPMEALALASDRAFLVLDSRFDPQAIATADNADPLAAARRAVGAFSDIASAAGDVLSAAKALVPATALAYETIAATAMDFASWSQGLISTAIQILAQASQAATDLQALIAPDAVAIYQPTASEMLQSISLRFYGTPHRWRDLMARNGLRSPILAGTETLVIPR